MFTDISSALDTRDILRDELPRHLLKERQSIEFGVAFNYNEAVQKQLLEVLLQRVAADTTPSNLVRYITGALDLPAGARDKLLRVAAWASDLIDVDEDLERHLETYRAHLSRDRKVVLVAHSQGNLYANRAHHRLFELDSQHDPASFAIVGIATPDKEVKGPTAPGCGREGCYTTLTQDKVMNAVRDNVPFTLPANVDNATQTEDPLHHRINDTYLMIPAVRNRIFDQIRAHVNQFPELLVEPKPAPVSARLGWQQSADLDLHVYEADATEHVYYYAPKGNGTLDRDSQMGGTEEEFYYAECKRLKPGMYEFAVGYYEGEGPVTANLVLMIGDQRYTVSHTFDGPQGADADLNPTPLAWVFIDPEVAGWFDFQVALPE